VAAVESGSDEENICTTDEAWQVYDTSWRTAVSSIVTGLGANCAGTKVFVLAKVVAGRLFVSVRHGCRTWFGHLRPGIR
jgi:hypothetical protein